MSILPQPLSTALNRLVPGNCLLCGDDSQTSLLCLACAADLPELAEPRCPQCALPTTHGERCGACLSKRPHFDTTLAIFRYEFPVDRIVHALKYGHQLAVANWLGERMASRLADTQAELIVPLPLHPERLRERGFNQSVEIARPLAKRLRRPLLLDGLSRIRATPPQAELALKERQRNVRGAFECSRDLGGRHVLLVDDVLTSGATLNECARILKMHGASRVDLAVGARALRQH